MAHSPKPVTTYRVTRGQTGNDIDIQIHTPRLRSENLSLTTWGSSHVLANVLHNIEVSRTTFSNDDIDILELGAGTGLVGLSASVIWKGNVVLTDLSGIVPGIYQNVLANAELLEAAGTKAKCGSLDWNEPSRLTLYQNDDCRETRLSPGSKASIILAADTIYDSDHPEMLVDTIFTWLKPGKQSRVVLAYPLRVAYLDAIRDLWERLDAGGLVSMQEGRADADTEFEDETLIEWAVFRWKDA